MYSIIQYLTLELKWLSRLPTRLFCAHTSRIFGSLLVATPPGFQYTDFSLRDRASAMHPLGRSCPFPIGSSMKTSGDLTDDLQSDFDAMPEYPLFFAHVVPTSDNL